MLRKLLMLVGTILAMQEGMAETQAALETKVYHYPYQVQIVVENHEIKEDGLTDNICRLRIYQKGHLLDKDERRFCTFLVDGKDVNGDGLKDVVIEMRGLGRASYSLTFLTVMPKTQILYYSLPGDIYQLRDMDGDGRYELQSWAVWYFGMRSMGIKTVLNWTAEKFVLNIPLTQRLNQQRWKALPDDLSVSFYVDLSGIQVQWDRVPTTYHDFVHQLFEQIMFALALGNQEKALSLMHKHLRFDNNAQRYLFMQEVVELLHSSMTEFDWDAIRWRNHWFLPIVSDDYCDLQKAEEFGGHCIWDEETKQANYVDFFSEFEIVSELFRELKRRESEKTDS